MQSPHTIQQTVDETASPEDDLELVGRFTVNYWSCVKAIIHSNKTYVWHTYKQYTLFYPLQVPPA